MCPEQEVFNFELTCGACPEQYDVFLEEKQVGYVRLRWGTLRCDYLYVNGEEIYCHNFDDGYKGCFDSEYEREYHLDLIAKALYNKIYESETVR